MTEADYYYLKGTDSLPKKHLEILGESFECFLYQKSLQETGYIPAEIFEGIKQMEADLSVWMKTETSEFIYGLAIILYHANYEKHLLLRDARILHATREEFLGGFNNMIEVLEKFKASPDSIESIVFTVSPDKAGRKPKRLRVSGEFWKNKIINALLYDESISSTLKSLRENENSSEILLRKDHEIKVKDKLARNYAYPLKEYLIDKWKIDTREAHYIGWICLIFIGLKENDLEETNQNPRGHYIVRERFRSLLLKAKKEMRQ